MGDRTYTSVESMVRDLTDDAELIEAIDNALDQQTIVRQLLSMRAVHGLSQTDIAEAMGCSQSRVSKMETSSDDDLRYGDLRRYAEAVRCELKSGVRPADLEPADEVKALAFGINDRLSRMADLSQHDEEIAKGVAHFLVEAYVNFSMIVGRVANALPRNPDGSSRIQVNVNLKGVTGSPEDTPSTEHDSRQKVAS